MDCEASFSPTGRNSIHINKDKECFVQYTIETDYHGIRKWNSIKVLNSCPLYRLVSKTHIPYM